MNSHSFAHLIALAAATILAAPSAALAAPDKPKNSSPDSTDPLSGPTVHDRNVPGVDNRFTDDAPAAGRRQPRIAHRDFLDALRSLASDPTPEPDRLTPDQQASIRAIEQEFRSAMQAFRAEHKDELELLRSDAGLPDPDRNNPSPDNQPARRADRGPDRPAPEAEPLGDDQRAPSAIEPGRRPIRARRANGQDTAPPAREPRADNRSRSPKDAGPGAKPDNHAQSDANLEARRRLAELMKSGPNPDDFHTRIWALLTEPQQALLRQRLEAPQRSKRPDRGEKPQRRRADDSPRKSPRDPAR